MTDQDLKSVKQRFGIIGNSALLNHAIKVAVQVAPTDVTVLITGESGTGKESFSKIIHQLSHRKHGNFIAINCGAIPEGTIDSELFGHEKGAFTGASDARKGYFEETNGGTIFLDEIGEMPLGTQARLLRVLENGEFIKVGSSKVLKTNVRVVAATNVNLLQAVQKNKFREDLYYRLNSVPIFVPPLRQRGQDIDLLFKKFASDFAERHREKPIVLDAQAKELLLAYRFPGNIRQLKNLVEHISVLEIENKQIDLACLKKYMLDQSENLLPVVTNQNSIFSSHDASAVNERDLIYKYILDSRKDIHEVRKDLNELKKVVHQLLEGQHIAGKQIIQQNKELFGELNGSSTIGSTTDFDLVQKSPLFFDQNNHFNSLNDSHTIDLDDVQDASYDAENELPATYSLEQIEKQTISDTLKKNNNKRKQTAIDLGISERTLYRKIKQYNLDEN